MDGWDASRVSPLLSPHPGTHLSPSLHSPLMDEGREIPLMHSSTQIDCDLGPSATGILAGCRQLGSPSHPAPPRAGVRVRVRAGSSSGVKLIGRGTRTDPALQPRSLKAHSWDSWDFFTSSIHSSWLSLSPASPNTTHVDPHIFATCRNCSTCTKGGNQEVMLKMLVLCVLCFLTPIFLHLVITRSSL